MGSFLELQCGVMTGWNAIRLFFSFRVPEKVSFRYIGSLEKKVQALSSSKNAGSIILYFKH